MAAIDQLMALEELGVGVVKTFHPTESDLVGVYLYDKIFKAPASTSTKQTFPEIEIYGKTALPPWEIWKTYQPFKFPFQDFIYFFARVRKLGGSRCSRTIGCDGGTWSETEAAKPVFVTGIEDPFGKLRKFRYEKNKDRGFEHHGAWLMDEFTINQAPELALCRIKVNDKGGGRSKKRKFVADSHENDNNKRNKRAFKSRKIEQTRDKNILMCEPSATTSTTTQQLSSSSHCEDLCNSYDYGMHFPPHDEGVLMLLSSHNNPVPDDFVCQNAGSSSQLQPSTIAHYSAERCNSADIGVLTTSFSSFDDQNLGGASEEISSSLLPCIIDLDHVPDHVYYAEAEKQQTFASPSHYDDQVVNVHEENYEQLRLSPTGFFYGDDEMLFQDSNLISSFDQWLASHQEQPQQLGPDTRCEEEPQQQDQQLLPSHSHCHEQQQQLPCHEQQQQLPCDDHDCDFPLDHPYLESDEFNGFYINEDQLRALQWLDSDDQNSASQEISSSLLPCIIDVDHVPDHVYYAEAEKQQTFASSSHYDDQVVHVHEENENPDLSPTGFFDADDELLFQDSNLISSFDQWLASQEEQQRQLGPDKRCEKEPQQLLPSSSHCDEQQRQQQLPGDDHDFDTPADHAYLESDEFNGFYINEHQPRALQWLDSDDQNSDIFQ